MLKKSLESRVIGIIGPGAPSNSVKLLNRTLKWSGKGYEWHADSKHSRSVCEKCGVVDNTKESFVHRNKTAGLNLPDGEDDLDADEAHKYASCAGTLLYHALDRPDLQFVPGKLMSALTAPKVENLALSKQVARYLKTRGDCCGKFCLQDWASEVVVRADATDAETRRSTDRTHLHIGRPLLESSVQQQVVGPAWEENEFYELVQGSAIGVQLREALLEKPRQMKIEYSTVKLLIETSPRVLTDTLGARGIVRRSGPERVKHLENRRLWTQDRSKNRRLWTQDRAKNRRLWTQD